ncbi:MAG: nitrous oxide reductase accessory protein NosL [Candidatus Competibacterales bacterium]|nr:nitrous oxide reductase accessory protein NosL [Candidatus Competibacterales bacterium]
MALVLLLTACGEDPRVAAVPAPAPLDREAIGRYCRMIVADHEGPKAQIFLAGRDEPVWFSSVRDGIAFTRLPEEPKDIAAFYVNDMSDTDWARPDDTTWIDARDAWYVIGSSRAGGMGAPEAVPFVSEPAATAFAAVHGGEVVRLEAIPDDYILGEVPSEPMPRGMGDGHHSGAPTDGTD